MWKLYLYNPGNVYKNSLTPEDKFDYSNLDPEYTEPMENFPKVVRIKRLTEHWIARTELLTPKAGAIRARQIYRIINPVLFSRTYLTGMRPEHHPSQFYKNKKKLNIVS